MSKVAIETGHRAHHTVGTTGCGFKLVPGLFALSHAPWGMGPVVSCLVQMCFVVVRTRPKELNEDKLADDKRTMGRPPRADLQDDRTE